MPNPLEILLVFLAPALLGAGVLWGIGRWVPAPEPARQTLAWALAVLLGFVLGVVLAEAVTLPDPFSDPAVAETSDEGSSGDAETAADRGTAAAIQSIWPGLPPASARGWMPWFVLFAFAGAMATCWPRMPWPAAWTVRVVLVVAMAVVVQWSLLPESWTDAWTQAPASESSHASAAWDFGDTQDEARLERQSIGWLAIGVVAPLMLLIAAHARRRDSRDAIKPVVASLLLWGAATAVAASGSVSLGKLGYALAGATAGAAVVAFFIVRRRQSEAGVTIAVFGFAVLLLLGLRVAELGPLSAALLLLAGVALPDWRTVAGGPPWAWATARILIVVLLLVPALAPPILAAA